MKNRLLVFGLLLCQCLALMAGQSFGADTVEVSQNIQKLRVLQFNTWSEGVVVKGGQEGIIKTIETVQPDILLLQEIRGQKFIDWLIDYFKSQGITYYGYSLNISTAVMSKYPIRSVRSSDELGRDSYAFVKAIVAIGDQELACYSVHLDWKHLPYYNVRGFDGQSSTRPYATIKRLSRVQDVLAENNLSRRPQEVQALIADARLECDSNRLVILGGDFNEPSFQDWTRETRHIRDHHGLVVPWTSTSMLHQTGFVDCYRSLYPDPVTHPGFTCNAGNQSAAKEDLYWAYGVDDRERIDLNFYYPDERLRLTDVFIVGPREDFYDGRIQIQQTDDRIMTPDCVWPSDHKAVLSEYELLINR